MFRLAASLAIAVAAMTLLTAQSPPSQVPTLTADECFHGLNELAAAAVFAELDEQQAEEVYGLLDQLQDACDAADMATAFKSIDAIEKLIGK